MGDHWVINQEDLFLMNIANQVVLRLEKKYPRLRFSFKSWKGHFAGIFFEIGWEGEDNIRLPSPTLEHWEGAKLIKEEACGEFFKREVERCFNSSCRIIEDQESIESVFSRHLDLLGDSIKFIEEVRLAYREIFE